MMSALASIGFCQLPLKSMCGMIKRKIFYKSLTEIEESFCDQEDDEELSQIAEKHLVNGVKIWKLITTWIIGFFRLGVTLVCLHLRFSETDGFVMDWSFLPDNSRLWLEMAYFLQFIGILVTSQSGIIVDMTTVLIGLQLIATLNVLNDYIRLINEKIKPIPNYLKTILEHHCNVVKRMNLLNEAVYEMSFVQIVISTLVLLFIFVLLRKDSSDIFAIISCLGVMSQIFALCAFGEIIKINTEKLSEAFYEVNWYEMSVKDQKTFLIILGMAQRKYGLKAAGMYVVDIYAFIQIVKLAFTYCAILYTVSN
ncbi:Odorant receptor [Sergentomyia squamirostris]